MEKPKTERVTLPIYGLGCWGGDAPIIERVLSRTSGVLYAYVNSATVMAYVEVDSAMCGPEMLRDVVKRAGFEAGKPGLR